MFDDVIISIPLSAAHETRSTEQSSFANLFDQFDSQFIEDSLYIISNCYFTPF
jgi:hypothetical protein